MGELKTDWLPRHKLSVDAYHRLGQSGVLTANDRVELIEGELIDMSPIGSRHAGVVKKLNHLLQSQLRDAAIVAIQDPVRLSGISEPQPDISVLRPRTDFYAEAHPGPADVLLLIEVADTSFKYDREIKIPLYARAEIPEVWLIDLEGNRFTTFKHPTEGSYAQATTLEAGDFAISSTNPSVSIAVADIVAM